ncbi:MAG: carbamoyltransferase HypF, partial [Endomicrobia bacterium]|nr:carbamoyltransferase HypF [Endomicrobiia bacterium]
TLPYDRKNTTMDIFKMCPHCYEEYTNPKSRRYHAQPNACHKCGPGLKLQIANGGEEVAESQKDIFDKTTGSSEDVKKVLDFVVREILNGKIFAIKSYGGYHLVCDATNDDSVLRLRKNKYREYKPFAMMASDIRIISQYCYVDEYEENVLNSSQAPIVLLLKKMQTTPVAARISRYVAPKSKYYGFMLPYTPLQYLIFYWLKKYNNDIPLVMTSGNLSDEPQVYRDEEAVEKLRGVVDYFLTYNREIITRCDDSVVKVFDKNVYFIRRSRGWSPEPIFINYHFEKPVISFGADLKNTFAVGRDNYVIISHHMGDLDNLEVVNEYKNSIDYYLNTFKINPEVVVYDLHPIYISSKIAKEFAKQYSLKYVSVQHHYAHMLSCMLDNNLTEKCIGIIFDGTGYGNDNNIWGSEFLVGDIFSFERKGYFDYINLIGGDKGIKEPYRTTVALLYEIYKDKNFVEKIWRKIVDGQLETKNLPKFKFEEIFNSVKFLIDAKINIVKTCGMGRIFDVVSVLCGVGLFNYYEGQLPQELEFYANQNQLFDKKDKDIYFWEIFERDGCYVVNTRRIITQIVEEILKGYHKNKIATKFHYTIAEICLDVALRIRNELNINKVVISGGVFQNILLLTAVIKLLSDNNFEVFFHRKVSPNDSGISFGQLLKYS